MYVSFAVAENLSLLTALKQSLLKRQASDKARVIKTLIEEFDYPKRGPGMMWEEVTRLIQRQGSLVRLGAAAERIIWGEGGVEKVEVTVDGRREVIEGSHFISSMPLRELIGKLDPAAPPDVLRAANKLHYRDFITVALVVNERELFPDNWIYIHDPEVRLGRIQNFKNWSPDMVPDPHKTCLGLEYFCFEGDGLWSMTDQELIKLGKQELVTLGLAEASAIEDGAVVRMPKAYPVYDAGYKQSLDVVRAFLGQLTNLQLSGATACISTTTRITRCSRRCWRSRTFWAPVTICGK